MLVSSHDGELAVTNVYADEAMWNLLTSFVYHFGHETVSLASELLIDIQNGNVLLGQQALNRIRLAAQFVNRCI